MCRYAIAIRRSELIGAISSIISLRIIVATLVLILIDIDNTITRLYLCVSTKWGIDLEDPPLVKISPALDIILSQPSDPAYSKYNRLAKLMHKLLL
ncbi:hypothetical protein LARI1_G009027 [Lachnellula arida]|uniref:Uncharacterized protein n=1 Tax=Lachnellula arida TaxID=1316785 RepID=A0A8T9AZF7_9HELO|nr:hypothetical protein LARI1_G009027 [Lachnellula arida]